MNKLLNKKSKTTEIPHLDVDGEIITDTSKRQKSLINILPILAKL